MFYYYYFNLKAVGAAHFWSGYSCWLLVKIYKKI